jgi:hypothetical protein
MQDDVDDVGRCRTMEKGLWCVRDTGQPGHRTTEAYARREKVSDRIETAISHRARESPASTPLP